jgi:tetratricopeptide (TPR) repeat protein
MYLSLAQQPGLADRESQRTLARALVARNEFPQAEKVLRALTAADPRDAESWFYLGALLYRNGYYGAALPALEKALALRPENFQAKVYRAVSLALVGRTKEAEPALQQLAGDPAGARDPDVLIVFAQLLYETERPQLALARIDQAIAATPQSPMAFFWRGRILLHMGRVGEAAKAAEQAVQLAPQLPFPRNLLVQIYRKQGRTAEAAQQAEWLRESEDRQTRGRPQ